MTATAEKEAVARYGAALVRDGDLVGLGAGSTVALLVRALGERIARGLHVRAVPASSETEALARGAGVEIADLGAVTRLGLVVDGADEVDPALDLVKGGGGALVREKVLASIAERFVVLVDSSKLVPRLGRGRLPVEVVPVAWRAVQARLASWQVPSALREVDGKPFVTDNGNYLLDASFGAIEAPGPLEASLNDIPGVVDCGLFVGMATEVVVGLPDGIRVIPQPR